MLYFPHPYRTMSGQEPGKDVLPGEYRTVDLIEIELYNLEKDENPLLQEQRVHL
ncbi:MAG: hypothetical protein WBG48_10840 [Pricia sp.]